MISNKIVIFYKKVVLTKLLPVPLTTLFDIVILIFQIFVLKHFLT